MGDEVNGAARTTDAQLLSRARAGDRSAFSRLVDRHKDAMVSYLYRLTGDRDRAEDLAQETFLRLYERRGQYAEQGKLAAYLYRIATNLLRSEERRRRRWRLLRPVFFSSNGYRPVPTPADDALRHELSATLRRAVAGLPVRYRVPLVLHELEGRSYREIARLLGCREGTIKSRVFRGRRALKRELRPFWEDRSP